MVHALETIRDLLKSDGVLIDLHPKGIPAEFWGHKGETSALLGHIDETDGFIEYRQAAWAVEQAVDKKWFRLQNSGEYDFIIHADSFDELKTYLAVEWTDAVIPPEVESKAAALLAEGITLRDFIHAGILKRL
jgi:hypothetical protein